MDDHRRKWDLNEFEKKAQERLAEDDEDGRTLTPFKRDLLRPRDYKINIDARIGKSVVVSKTGQVSNSGGYYCDVCDCVVKDSINFLDHVNGRKHIKNLGMSMKIERSSLQQVQDRINKHKLKHEEERKEYSFEQRLKELKQEEEKMRERQKEKQKAKKRKHHEDSPINSNENEIASIMGFGGFGSSKNNS